jgi:amino acid transporter
VLQLALGVLVMAGAGAVAGVVWEWLWTAPVGVVVDHRWVAQDEAGLRGQFSGTGWFVVVATLAGLVAGLVVALLLDRVPLLTLLAVVLGSAAATWLMLRVGAALGPADPAHLALTAKDGTHLPGQLDVSRRSPWVSLPAGALVALTLVFIGLSSARRVRVDHDDAG